MKRSYVASLVVAAAAVASPLAYLLHTSTVTAATTAQDPGVRGGPPAAGNPLPGLTQTQLALFNLAKQEFLSVEDVGDGLGPTMNLNSCVGCHIQPAAGGSSPPTNPQVAFATLNGADNVLPSFISLHGPVREARFVKNADGSPDGGVHALFTIQGRSDAPGCTVPPTDFHTALANNNVIFRIPTPTFGAGLIEQIPDRVLTANQAANATTKRSLGIRGRPNIILSGNAISGQLNHNGNDGTTARFGWKGQNKSLLLFAGEAYNVEMGITNDLFQTERYESADCTFAGGTPNDATTANTLSAIEQFAVFMRFLAPPTPNPSFPGGTTSIQRGKSQFNSIGCALCHTPTLTTGKSTIAALSN